MPLDVTQPHPAGAADARRRAVAIWLLVICGMILVMIGLGGATRLTGSGLSIMEWAPLRGTLPPLTEAEWQRLFALYRQIPQYTLLNPDLDLDGFRRIFWLEYVHRLWGRLIGLAFLLPLLWLWWRGAIDKRLRPRLLVLFMLGGLQGGVGWFMVASGFFPDSIAVSQYWLVVHLTLALVLYGAILWTALSLLRPASLPGGPPALRRAVFACCVLVTVTIVAGGFVAGLKAGLTYNTFPLMDGRIVPDGYGDLRPAWRNLTENIAAVQFNHRLLATATAVTVLGTLAWGLTRARGLAKAGLWALGIAVAVQYGLGVATLLAVVPPLLGTAHQIVAALVLSAALLALHGLRPTAALAHDPLHEDGFRQEGRA
ncbi:Heme A synthase [Rhodovastum atsumiense]|uniref:Heme A synthase n=1 Tax=Rhodovastum atsumiense TaxID=504468 RepID=A0A5M6IN00_9PROT|nr:COX15/CtaA family protein [Rhodovastum atsumiense]KAA5608928.1 heme A synthase [Rhodovastum atsumiense]CAH2604218.1 Heme A synthase [Rhodovastum atsumiense]